MTIITIGIDLAKNIFAVHGVNENGKPELVKPRVSRDQRLPCCLRFYALFWLRGPWCGVGVRLVVCRPFGAAS